LQKLTFQTVQHQVTLHDAQPLVDGGIVVQVLGQLQVCLVLCACRFCTALRLGRTAVPCSLTPFSPLATSRRHLRHPQTDADQPVSFMQTFLLRTDATGNWFVAHDIFRLVLHNG